MIPHKLEIIRSLESGKNQREVVATYNIGSSTVYKETEGPLIIVMILNQWMKVDIQMEYSSD